jgi:hypothetical protein
MCSGTVVWRWFPLARKRAAIRSPLRKISTARVGQPHLDFAAGKAMKHAAEMAFELDMVVDADPAEAPLGKAIGLSRQRGEVGPVQLKLASFTQSGPLACKHLRDGRGDRHSSTRSEQVWRTPGTLLLFHHGLVAEAVLDPGQCRFSSLEVRLAAALPTY